MNIKLQQVDQAEWKTLEDLEKQSANELFHPLFGKEEFKKYIGKSKVFFVILNNEKIGTISYIDHGDYYEIDGMTVVPQHRRKGIAKIAFKKILNDPKEKKEWRLVTHPKKYRIITYLFKSGI